MMMANYAETCSVCICNKGKKNEHQPKLHIDGKIYQRLVLQSFNLHDIFYKNA
jgi:hypothetical protein